MPWSILWTDQALHSIARIDPPVARRILKKVEQAAADPLHFFSRLVASDEYKLRMGDYRLLAVLDRTSKTIVVEQVDHRSRIYERRRGPRVGMPLSRRLHFRWELPEDFVVTPWDVKGQVDYDRLVTQFGTQRLTPDLLEQIRKAAGELHPMLRRGVFYSHRDLDWILREYGKGNRFALYTGRGPSSGIHIGHMLPWFFTKWIQEKFRATLYFQITDDEKFLFKDFDNLEEATKVGYENILDIIAMGFDPKLTRIFLDTEYIRHLYPIAVEVAKRITFSTTQAVFGFENSNNIGEIFYTSIQAAPAFLPTVEAGHEVPVLIPCGIDQDPHFRVARDVAPKLGYPKPALIHNKLLPSLLGPTGKMSASIPESSIFTTDTEAQAQKKIMNTFTGGRATVEEQRRLGANPYICSIFAQYNYIFEPDDRHLAEVERTCKNGERLCGDCKTELWGKVRSWLKAHHAAREKAKDRVEQFIVRD